MGWFRTNSTSASNLTIAHWGSGGAPSFNRQYIGLESGVLWNRYVSDTISGGSNLNDGQWHHFAMTNPASALIGQVIVYIDGVIVPVTTTSSGSTINIGTTSDLTIGALPTPSNYFPGDLDDFRLYNVQLTADQIFALVRAGIEPPTTNLQAHWKLNEGSGTTAADSSGNSRTITFTGSPSWLTTFKKFYTQRWRATSTDLVTTGTVQNFYYTTSKKPGSIGRLQFSNDNTTWKAPNNSTVSGYGAYEFDGVNDEINCGSDASIDNMFSGGGTLMFWMYARSYGESTLGRIIHKGSAGSNSSTTQVYWAVNKLRFARSFSSTDGRWDTLNDIPLNRWHHVAITYNENSTTNDPIIYINGISVPITESSTPAGSATTDAAGNLTLGSWDSSTRWFDGFLSDVRIYKGEVLSSTAVYDYYAKSVEPSETLDAHYKFNGNANDETGNNNGTANGAVNTTNWYRLPPIGYGEVEGVNARYFDGVNDSISVADNDVFTFGNSATDSAFSVSAWVYMQEATNFKIICKDDNSSFREWVFHTTASDLLQVGLVDNSTGGTIGRATGDVSHLTDRWIHVAFSYSGSGAASGILVYINGSRCDTTDQSFGSYTAMENTAQGVQIGARGASQFSQGRIANVSIWSDVRTAAEIRAEVENGYTDLADGNLVAHWPLNDSGSTAVNADNPGTHDGSISGASLISDISRPVAALPTQKTISLSALSYSDTLYYRFLAENSFSSHTYALTEVTAEFSSLTGVRLLPLMGVGT